MIEETRYSSNGNGSWQPEGPFLNDIPLTSAAEAATSPARAFAPAYQVVSPFVSQYAGEEAQPGAQAEQFAALIGELHDPEFNEAIEEVASEAAAILEDRFSSEVASSRQLQDAERVLSDYIEPLRTAADNLVDQMAAEAVDRDIAELSEEEVDALFESVQPQENLSPAFENFLDGWKKKIKGALNVVKKVGSFLPQNLIFGKLKALVRPLLDRVLKFAINKLPVSLRPIAQQLAKRFLGPALAGEAVESEDNGEAAAADVAEIQEELDVEIAGYLVEGEDFDREAQVERSIAAQSAPATDPLQELDRARGEFARGVIRLQDGESAQPLVENFIPAILAALKLGISVIGRPRVVNFLADLVAKLIGKYIGQQQAVTLSRALVDTGLRLVSLEAAESPEPIASGYALASTVEDTVSRLMETVPETAWESDALLEGYVQEAFERAASAHFPDPLIRSELHEASQANGAWVALPAGTPRKRYKKYSRIIDVTITPQMAAQIRTFGGTTLRDFLRNRMGVAADKPIRARAHLYEAIPGTWLSIASHHEKRVPGLGTARRESWSLIHPLTPEAAGLLLNEPGLGKAVDPRFLVRRSKIAVGQRFYYLEIPGARVRIIPRRPRGVPRPAKSSQTQIIFDFPARQLRVFLYYSEIDAQELAKSLRKRLPISAALTAMRAKLDINLEKILSGDPNGGVRFIHEAVPTEQFAMKTAGPILRAVGKYVGPIILKWILDVFKRELEARYDSFVAEFEKTQKDPADGVTVALIFNAPGLLQVLRGLFSPTGLLSIPSAIKSLARAAFTDFKLALKAGFAVV